MGIGDAESDDMSIGEAEPNNMSIGEAEPNNMQIGEGERDELGKLESEISMGELDPEGYTVLGGDGKTIPSDERFEVT